jgi:hypothetical protein
MIMRILAFLLLFAPAAMAHESRPLFVSVTESSGDGVRLQWRAPASVDEAGAPMVRLEGCDASTSPKPGIDGATFYQCKDGIDDARLVIEWPVYNPSVTTLVRITRDDGVVATRVMPPDQSSADLNSDGASAAGAYFPLGVRHILGGVDHLLFLALLAIVAGAPRRIFIAATGFTIAHSVTLAMTALGAVTVSVAAVEVVIALSIVFLAAEIARGGRETLTFRRPALVASLFGLAHGAGFASALAEIGLPQSARIPALLFFNVGVEAGQIALLALGLLLLTLMQRFALAAHDMVAGAPAQRLTAYGIGVVAAYWTIERAAGALA